MILQCHKLQQFFHFLGPAFLVQLESAEAVHLVVNHLRTWRGNDVLVVSTPDTVNPSTDVLDKNVQLPADLLQSELTANLEALARNNFPGLLVPKTPARGAKGLAYNLI